MIGAVALLARPRELVASVTINDSDAHQGVNLPYRVGVEYRFKVETRGGFLLGFYHSKEVAKAIRDKYNHPPGEQVMRRISSWAVVRRGIDHLRGETGATRWARVTGPDDQVMRFLRVAT